MSSVTEESNKYDAPIPAIGMPVQWCPAADVNQTPHAATVIATNAYGTVRLQVLHGNGTLSLRQSVPHIDDPKLKSRGTEYKTTNGAWRHVAGFVPDGIPATLAEIRIVKLHGEGLTATGIADKMGGRWSFQRVGALLRKFDIVSHKEIPSTDNPKE